VYGVEMKAAYPGDYCIHHLPEAKEGYAMKENTVIAFRNPADFQEDPLTEVLQAGARNSSSRRPIVTPIG
tara:strand:- start:71 stop:280 length:210 start_codon:yes stop_codon:yes gene_type:complete